MASETDLKVLLQGNYIVRCVLVNVTARMVIITGIQFVM